MNDSEKAIASLGNALVQMHGCGRYTPEDVDELETAAWGALKLLEEQETIVRCKDCKYAILTYQGELKYCKYFVDEYGFMNGGDPLYLEGDFFCAAGERR